MTKRLKLSRIPMMVVLTGLLIGMALPAYCQNSQIIQTETTQTYCACVIPGTNPPQYTPGSVSVTGIAGAIGWETIEGTCEGAQTACTWEYYGATTWSCSYTVPHGKCYTGEVQFVAKREPPSDVPSCTAPAPGDTAPPKCVSQQFPFTTGGYVLANGTFTNCK